MVNLLNLKSWKDIIRVWCNSTDVEFAQTVNNFRLILWSSIWFFTNLEKHMLEINNSINTSLEKLNKRLNCFWHHFNINKWITERIS